MQRHTLDPTSLIFGLVFAGAGGLLLAGRIDVLTHANWLVPVLLIIVALAMLASASWPSWKPGRPVDGHAGDGDRTSSEDGR